MSSSKSLPLPSSDSEIERMTDFEKFGLQPYTLESTKSEIPVGYGKNSVSDLANSNDIATNTMNGRIGSKSWCKCECCTLMETSIEGVSCLEMSVISKPRFLSTLCLNVCRSDPHFVL